MHFTAIADTDKGIKKNTNQDSVLIKHASTSKGEVLLAVICDGMGGLEKGELASATVIRAFADWFDNELPYELIRLDLSVIGEKWALLLKELNMKILEYSKKQGGNMGTTFTGVLLVDGEYVVGHIGDTRLYYISSGVKQMTEDHTYVAREMKLGNMTLEESKVDKRRNMLLQCVGASRGVEPQILCGTVAPGTYMLCSDGFRHEITEREMQNELNSGMLTDKKAMHGQALKLIELVKSRQEQDNISVILIKAE